MTNEYADQHYAEEILLSVVDWVMSDAPSWFDDSFVKSVHEQYEQGRKLSPRQVEALENIAEKFNIQ